MTEPRTEAGRALLDEEYPDWPYAFADDSVIHDTREEFAQRILAIEAEAAARLAELEAALRDVLDFHKLDDPECASCWTAHALLDTRSPESITDGARSRQTEAPVNEEAPSRPKPGVST